MRSPNEDFSQKSELLNNPFWQFSLTVYQCEQVKEHCLFLQNSTGANVNLLLLCCWLACTMPPISQAEFIEACESIKDWHANVTLPLRHVRQYLKKRQDEPGINALYQEILTQEIHSESYQQKTLYSYFTQKQPCLPEKDDALTLRYLYWLFEHMAIGIDNNLKQRLGNFANMTSHTFHLSKDLNYKV